MTDETTKDAAAQTPVEATEEKSTAEIPVRETPAESATADTPAADKTNNMKVSKNVETLASQGAYANLQPGMTIKVFQKIKETSAKGEEKERLQMFEGIILAHKHGKEAGATITVRKKVGNIGVERIFPLNSPFIEKIEIVKAARVRRAKLYFLRNWKKRLLEKTVD